MHFLILSSIIMFVFSGIAWFGGLLFVSGVLMPIAKHDETYKHNLFYQSARRFYGISVMCFWTMAITGGIILATNQKYIFLKFNSDWDYLLAIAELIFIAAAILTFIIGNEFKAIEANFDGVFDFHMKNIFNFTKANIYLGTIFLIILLSMVYYG